MNGSSRSRVGAMGERVGAKRSAGTFFSLCHCGLMHNRRTMILSQMQTQVSIRRKAYPCPTCKQKIQWRMQKEKEREGGEERTGTGEWIGAIVTSMV